MIAIYIIITTILCLTIGIFIGFLVRKKVVESRVDSIENYSKKILGEAQKEAKTLKKEAALQAKDKVYQMKVEFEKETREKKEQLQIQERRFIHKEGMGKLFGHKKLRQFTGPA